MNKSYSYINKYDKFESVGALFCLLGFILLFTNSNNWLGFVNLVWLSWMLIGIGFSVIGMVKFLFYKRNWGEKFTIFNKENSNLEKPFATKFEKTILLMESIFCFVLGLGSLLYVIYITFSIVKPF
jgi:hypothetical protein